MINKDITFKVLFAVELALLPMLFFVNLYFEEWSICLIVGLIFATRVAIEFVANNKDLLTFVLKQVSDIVVFTVVAIFFLTAEPIANVALAVIAIICVFLRCLLLIALRNAVLPDIIQAFDHCSLLFFLASILALSFETFYATLSIVAFIALILTSIASIGYKIYFMFKFHYIQNFFTKLFKRKK